VAALVMSVFEELVGRSGAEIFEQAGFSLEQPFDTLRNYRVVLLGTGRFWLRIVMRASAPV
jgi:hypothetical protein